MTQRETPPRLRSGGAVRCRARSGRPCTLEVTYALRLWGRIRGLWGGAVHAVLEPLTLSDELIK